MFDKFKEECGLVGVWNSPEAANIAYLGLCAQQHRGQEGAGVVSFEKVFHRHRGLGLVHDVFRDFDFAELPGNSALGHVRYTTAGNNRVENVQPFFSHIASGDVAIAHNGNLVNTEELKHELTSTGAIFHTSSDTEIFHHLLAREGATEDFDQILFNALQKVRGAYSLLLLTDSAFYVVRDPNGLRPLILGKSDDAWLAASESCAFDLIGAEYYREVQPGEVVKIDLSGKEHSFFPFEPVKPSPCIFEYVYFARPDSKIYGRDVYSVRKRMGEVLAAEKPVAADMVVPVPDSGITAAIGYAQASNIPLEMALIRNHYVGRTFIEPKQSIRDFGVRIKLNPNHDLIAGKSIVVVDDSIVRGTTSRKLVKMFKDAGAREIHFRISAPPTTHPCFYGIDTPQRDKLIAAKYTVDEIQDYLEVDSLAYLSLEGLYRAVNDEQDCSYCDACFSGDYPVQIGAHKL